MAYEYLRFIPTSYYKNTLYDFVAIVRDMKQKVSVSLDKANLEWCVEQVKSGRFRSLSHAIDYAISELRKA